MNFIKKYNLLILIIIFILNNIFLISNNGFYWDDWCLILPESITAITKGVGLSFMEQFHNYFMTINKFSALIYHLLIVASDLFSIIILFKVFNKLKFDSFHIFLILLFYVIIPFNEAKINISTINYSFGILLYLVSTLLFIDNLSKNNIYTRIISIILLFISFALLPSLIIFSFAITSFFVFYDLNKNSFILNKIYSSIFLKIDYYLILIFFWIFRSHYLKPTGIYEKSGYRTFSFSNILNSPVKILQSFYDNIIGIHNLIPLYFSLSFILFFFIVYFIIKKIIKKKSDLDIKYNFLIIGLYLFVFATFSYSILGLTPEFGSVNSRHQILIRLAAPFLLTYLYLKLPSINIQVLFLTILLTSSFSYNYSSQLKFQKSWFKQLALEKLFKNDTRIKNGDNILIIDNTTFYNEYNGTYATYCLNGILYKALNNQTHIAIDSKQYEAQGFEIGIDSTDEMMKNIYHVNEVKNFKTLDYTYIINSGSQLLTYKKNIIMLFQYYFFPDKFYKSLDDIIVLNYSPCLTN